MQNMKQIRMMAFDLDGTLLKEHAVLSPAARNALLQLKKNHIFVVINSGRPLYSIRSIVPEELFDYALCLNGQMIWRTKDGAVTEYPRLNEEARRKMLGIAERYPVFLHCVENGRSYYFCTKNHLPLKRIYDLLRQTARPFMKNHDYPDTVLTNPEIITEWNTPKICFAGFSFTLRKIRSLLHEDYSCVLTNSHWLEIMHKGVSKGNALKTVMDMEGIGKEECAAFGDGENDRDMFEAAGLGIAVANAMPSLKEKADLIIRSGAEDGPAVWIIDYLSGKVKL